MSRIGKQPIALPDGVKAEVRPTEIAFSGPKGSLTTPLPHGISATLDDGELVFERVGGGKQQRAYHGLARSLAANAVLGITEGFSIELEIQGIGYRAAAQGRKLTLQLGFSQPVEFDAPEGIEVETPEPTRIIVSGIDRQLVGQIASEIRRLRPPDVYKGKGVRYRGEVVHRKVGKAGVTTAV